MRVGLLMCGHVDPRALHVGGDYPELFGALFAEHDVELVRFDADRGDLPASLDDCDGWITSPSRASAYDDEPWVHGMVELVRRLVEEERPFAGICFGHQLMAQALGGRVERATGGWGVGVHGYDLVAAPWWTGPLEPGSRFHLVASHEDQVTRLPAGAELLATADYCPIAMMALGKRAFGLQPHPEFTAPLSAALLDLRVEMIGAERVEQARQTMATPLDRATVAAWIVRFLAGRGEGGPQ